MLPALLLAVAALVSQAQTGASRLILAAVTDSRGRPVVDVGPDDFVVQESAAAREILSVRIADYPVVLLLDTSLAARADFQLMQKAALHFIERLGRDRPVIVGTFGDVPRLLARFEDDRSLVLERLSALPPGGIGGSQLLRGAALAAGTLHATGALFSSVVVLSASGVDSSRDTPEDSVGTIVESGTMLHVIANLESNTSRAGRQLRTLIEGTHGDYTPIYSAASYQAALDRLADRLSSEMLVEYLVPPGSKPIDAKVGIRVPGAHVRGLGVAPK